MSPLETPSRQQPPGARTVPAVRTPDAQGAGAAPGGESPGPGEPGVSWRFPARPVHAHLARVWLEAFMADGGPGPEAAYCAAVVFSELVTNAVVHGTGPVRALASVSPDLIECEVTDEGADLPVVYEAGADDEHHRGLSLVDALATEWYVCRRSAGGKTVRFIVRG